MITKSSYMMQAIIYKPTKSCMQSGLQNKKWLLEFEHNGDSYIEPVMGWKGSKDTMQEVRLSFDTQEQAENFAKKNNIHYELILPQEKKIKIKSYADNFK